MSAALQTATSVVPWRRWVPALGWLRSYQPGWLRGDIVAGVTLAAYLLPAGIGDASLANLPPQAGIYACLFSGLIFWLFCSSRHTTITVTSAISLLMGSSLGTLAGGDPSRFGALAAGTALLVAAFAFIAWMLKAGVIVKFISETVLIGFKSGVALYLASTQLPKLFGIHGSHGNFWERSWTFITHLGDTSLMSLALGVGALAILILGKKFLPNRPVAIFVVAGGIAVASLTDLGHHGVKVLGEVPQGLPPIGLPALHWSDINELLPLALACFLLGAVETVAIGRSFAQKHGYRLDSNQEFLGLAGANLAAGLGQGFPVSGGMSQSLVNESGGARTPLSGLIAAGIVLLVALFLSGLLRNLPQPVLAAIVLFAVTGLLKISALRRLWKFHRSEFVIAMAAVAGVLGSGLLRGVMLGVLISILMLLRRASRPNIAFLGRIPGTRRFSDIDRHPDNERIPGALIVRVESSLLYFNVEHVRDTVAEKLQSAPEPVKLVLLDLSNVPHVDLAGAEMLRDVQQELAAKGIDFRIVEARSSVRDFLRIEGLEEKMGHIGRFKSVADALHEFQSEQSRSPSKTDAIGFPTVAG
ncbi:MAG: SulP family inorganic anion transporter [Verrucomicrobia subdivision 3 bacterium]|nr:SulP family inorganic anion transporter [Limisphaerales bacterium]